MTAKNKRDLALAVKFVVLGVFLVLVMFPFVWMLLTSLKGSQGEIYAFPVKYLPNPVSFVNYVEMLWKGSFARYMLNSLICSSIFSTLLPAAGSLFGVYCDFGQLRDQPLPFPA